MINAFVQISNPQSVGQGPSGVSTEASGEFNLRVEPTKPVVPLWLTVKFIGYEPALIALDASRFKAFVVEIEMRPAGMHDPQLGLSAYAVRGFASCAP